MLDNYCLSALPLHKPFHFSLYFSFISLVTEKNRSHPCGRNENNLLKQTPEDNMPKNNDNNSMFTTKYIKYIDTGLRKWYFVIIKNVFVNRYFMQHF